MKLGKVLLLASASLILTACQNNGVKNWSNASAATPAVRVGTNTENVVKISYAISEQREELSQESIQRLQKARDWVNQINAESVAVDEQHPILLNNIDTVNPNAYLYIDEYNVRLGKVRIGQGKHQNFRVAALGSSDKSHIYSNLNIYNCRERKNLTAIIYTYTIETGEAKAFAPEAKWDEPNRGTAQRWLLNAVCSATLVKEGNDLSIGYSVLLNDLG